MMKKLSFVVLALVVLGLLVLSQTFFVVGQSQQAIVLQLGQPMGDPDHPETYIKGPGIHYKTPFIQDALLFDNVILPVDSDPEQVVISSATVNADDSADDDLTTPIATPPAPAQTPVQPTTQTPSDAVKPATATTGPIINNVSGEPIIVETFARYKIIDPLQFLKTRRGHCHRGHRRARCREARVGCESRRHARRTWPHDAAAIIIAKPRPNHGQYPRTRE